MPASPESRGWSIVVACCCLALASAIAVIVLSWLTATPTIRDAEAFAEPNALIAYSTTAIRPNLLMVSGDHLVFDRLRHDWSPLSAGRRPTWRFTPFSYRIERSPTPASAVLLTCAGDSIRGCDRSIALVGELRSADITHVEIVVDGRWQRHLVFGQGFIVPIDRRRQIGDIRWLQIDGDDVEVVWAIDRDLDGQIAPRPSGPESVTAVRRLQAR